MKRLIGLTMVGFVLLGTAIGEEEKSSQKKDQRIRFAPVAVYLDSGEQPLAAYQLELKAVHGEVKIVGVEGGESKAFREPPYYDPAALMHDRIILAAFNTGKDLPRGKTKVAVVHLEILGDAEPEYSAILMAAATVDGKEISAVVSVEKVSVEEEVKP